MREQPQARSRGDPPRGGRTSSGQIRETYDTRVESKIHRPANLAAARATCQLAAAARRSHARRGARPAQNAGVQAESPEKCVCAVESGPRRGGSGLVPPLPPGQTDRRRILWSLHLRQGNSISIYCVRDDAAPALLCVLYLRNGLHTSCPVQGAGNFRPPCPDKACYVQPGPRPGPLLPLAD